MADPSAVAKFVSDRHFGIGSDGLIPDQTFGYRRLRDGYVQYGRVPRALCGGNGIRCVAKYVYDHGIVKKKNISVATRSGIKYLELTVTEGKVSKVKVNMGTPILTAAQIPVVADTEQVIDAPLEIGGAVYHVTAVSMGNPHAVVYMDDVENLDIASVGSAV